MSIDMQASKEFVTYEVDLRTVPAWQGRVDALRIDPINGAHESRAHFELDWIAVYQAPPRLLPLLPLWNGPDELLVGFENRGGWATELPIEFFHDDLMIGRIARLDKTASSEVALDASRFPPTSWIEARHLGRTLWRGRFVRPPTHASSLLPRTRGFDTRPSISISSGTGILQDDANRNVRLSPIASVTLRDPAGTHTYLEFDPTRVGPLAESVVYRETMIDERVGEVVCTVLVSGTPSIRIVPSCGSSPLRAPRPRPRTLAARALRSCS